MLYMEIMDVYYEIHKNYVTAFGGQDEELLNRLAPEFYI